MLWDGVKELARHTQHHATLKNGAIKIWPFSNLIQHVQHLSHNNGARFCIEMLHAFDQAGLNSLYLQHQKRLHVLSSLAIDCFVPFTNSSPEVRTLIILISFTDPTSLIVLDQKITVNASVWGNFVLCCHTAKDQMGCSFKNPKFIKWGLHRLDLNYNCISMLCAQWQICFTPNMWLHSSGSSAELESGYFSTVA